MVYLEIASCLFGDGLVMEKLVRDSYVPVCRLSLISYGSISGKAQRKKSFKIYIR